MHAPDSKFSTFVRLGYFARALLYLMLGYVALTSVGAIREGAEGVFRAIYEVPGGTVLLWLMTFGFTFYALFRLASTAFDIEHHGSDKRGWFARAGHAASAIGHLALAWTAWGFAVSEPGDGNGAQEAAAGLLAMPLGGTLLGLVGLGFLAAAAQQAKEGISGSFMCWIASSAPSYTRALGTIGYLARAVVFTIIAWSLVKAGWLEGGTSQIKTLAEAVAALSDKGLAFTLVAGGMVVFGAFSLLLARYRVIPELDLKRRIPAFRA